jgi:hypothetical protein
LQNIFLVTNKSPHHLRGRPRKLPLSLFAPPSYHSHCDEKNESRR